MPEAEALYTRMGFERIERYNDNPVPGIVFFRKHLGSAAQDLVTR
jgi:hypothetical protein